MPSGNRLECAPFKPRNADVNLRACHLDVSNVATCIGELFERNEVLRWRGDAALHLAKGRSVSTPMMHQVLRLRYGKVRDAQVVELPYENRNLAMLVVLPDRNRFEAVRGEMDAEWLMDLHKHLENRSVGLTFPRFHVSFTGMGVVAALGACGMGLPFLGDADFSGISNQARLHLGAVRQSATIEVDERGTVATVAVSFVRHNDIVPFTVDRPFLFFILRENGPILFMGEVGDPTA